jgi:hypothetical protein
VSAGLPVGRQEGGVHGRLSFGDVDSGLPEQRAAGVAALDLQAQ